MPNTFLIILVWFGVPIHLHCVIGWQFQQILSIFDQKKMGNFMVF